MTQVALLWLRSDLRLQDNQALSWAVEHGYKVLPYYHHNEHSDEWQRGGASKWWLHYALQDLEEQITQLGGQLLLGNPEYTSADAIQEVLQQHQVRAVLWNRCYEPHRIKEDTQIKAALKSQGYQVKSFNSNTLFDPTKTFNKSGSPFKVFTPFWKSLAQQEVAYAEPLDETSISWASPQLQRRLDDLSLLPTIGWDAGMHSSWEVSRSAGLARLGQFSQARAIVYGDYRDRPDLEGTSKLSPYLHFGQLGPREVLHQLRSLSHPDVESGITRQLFWREFGQHLLYHFPHSPTQALYEKYQLFPWEENDQFLRAWQRGETGYPIVDAGMRELWTTGWMHNRVRMIVGSLLVKHLLQPWQAGAEWFWDTLVDADLGNNTMGWQWIAGSGADGAPYFRVFNPITQGQKFDITGDYVRKWCPELAHLPNKYLHCPFDAPDLELRAAGIILGRNYPAPIIGHKEGRQKALDAFAAFKEISA